MGPWGAMATLFMTFLLNWRHFCGLLKPWEGLGHHLGVKLVTFGDCLATLCSNWSQLAKHVAKGPFSGQKLVPKGSMLDTDLLLLVFCLRSFSKVCFFIDFSQFGRPRVPQIVNI